MGGEREFENSLEFTPTWLLAGVCTVIVLISYAAVHIFYRVRKFLSEQQQLIYLSLHKVTEALLEELALLGLISLFLTFSGNLLTKICVPPGILHHDMIPCRLADRLKAEVERQADANPTTSFCSGKNKVPLLSAEIVHQIHIFIFLLGAVHIILSFLVFLLGNLSIKRWGKYNIDKIENDYIKAMKDGKF